MGMTWKSKVKSLAPGGQSIQHPRSPGLSIPAIQGSAPYISSVSPQSRAQLPILAQRPRSPGLSSLDWRNIPAIRGSAPYISSASPHSRAQLPRLAKQSENSAPHTGSASLLLQGSGLCGLSNLNSPRLTYSFGSVVLLLKGSTLALVGSLKHNRPLHQLSYFVSPLGFGYPVGPVLAWSLFPSTRPPLF